MYIISKGWPRRGGTPAPSSWTSGPSPAGAFLGHPGCPRVHFLSPFWVLSLLPGLPVLRWCLLQPQQQVLQPPPPSPSYAFCVSCAFYPFYASYPSFSSSSCHHLLDPNSWQVMGSELGSWPFLQVTSLQKESETEQEMQVLGVFWELSQVTLTQIGTRTRAGGWGWKPLFSWVLAFWTPS